MLKTQVSPGWTELERLALIAEMSGLLHKVASRYIITRNQILRVCETIQVVSNESGQFLTDNRDTIMNLDEIFTLPMIGGS